MTEYDFSPGAINAHRERMAGISRWVDTTQQHSSEFGNPFTPPTPAPPFRSIQPSASPQRPSMSRHPSERDRDKRMPSRSNTTPAAPRDERRGHRGRSYSLHDSAQVQPAYYYPTATTPGYSQYPTPSSSKPPSRSSSRHPSHHGHRSRRSSSSAHQPQAQTVILPNGAVGARVVPNRSNSTPVYVQQPVVQPYAIQVGGSGSGNRKSKGEQYLGYVVQPQSSQSTGKSSAKQPPLLKRLLTFNLSPTRSGSRSATPRDVRSPVSPPGKDRRGRKMVRTRSY